MDIHEIRLRGKQAYPRSESERTRLIKKMIRPMQCHSAFESAGVIGVFASRVWEVDLALLWSAHLDRFVFPKVDEQLPVRLTFYSLTDASDLEAGYKGILEPKISIKRQVNTWNSNDLLLIPGLAFDRAGGRVGSGKGMYDRFLTQFPGVKWGVCWDEQLVEERLPLSAHDIRMDGIWTPQGLVSV